MNGMTGIYERNEWLKFIRWMKWINEWNQRINEWHEWMNARVNECMSERMNAWMSESINQWTNECMDGMNERTIDWVHEWMNETWIWSVTGKSTKKNCSGIPICHASGTGISFCSPSSSWLRSGARSWGPAVPTVIWRYLELIVEVQKEEREEEAEGWASNPDKI